MHPAGVFDGVLPRRRTLPRYRLEVSYPDAEPVVVRDAYSFAPSLGELDLHLISEGRHERLWDALGAHPRTLDGTTGTSFAVWAPGARAVSVVGDFNVWNERAHPMRSLGAAGVWELFVPEAAAGHAYKFAIRGADGVVRLKADPVALRAELPPKTGSVVFEPHHRWADAEWLERRRVGRAARGADLDLRGAPGLLAAQHAGGQPLADATRSWPTSSRTTRSTSASRTSSCCPSWSTRSRARGAIR